jgi:hypothetical protein
VAADHSVGLMADRGQRGVEPLAVGEAVAGGIVAACAGFRATRPAVAWKWLIIYGCSNPRGPTGNAVMPGDRALFTSPLKFAVDRWGAFRPAAAACGVGFCIAFVSGPRTGFLKWSSVICR